MRDDDAATTRKRASARMKARQRRAERAREDAARGPIARGDLYVIPGHEDEPYEVWRVTGRDIVLRSTVRPGAFLMSSVSGPFNRPELGYWVTRAG